jgi:hypothetical protein
MTWHTAMPRVDEYSDTRVSLLNYTHYHCHVLCFSRKCDRLESQIETGYCVEQSHHETLMFLIGTLDVESRRLAHVDSLVTEPT